MTGAQIGWIIETVAGTGVQGHAGDGGPATAALLNNPFDLAFDPEGNLIFSDTFNHRICKIDARTGLISTIAGTGERGFDGDGGPAARAKLNEPYGVVIDSGGRIFFADRLNRRVRSVDSRGTIATLAGDGSGKYGGDGGPAAVAGLAEPNGLALEGDRLYIADVADHRVRVVDLRTGTIATFAGTGAARHDGDGGPAAAAGIFGARAVAFAPDGSLYVMERQGSCIRQIRDGIIATVAGTGERGYAGDGADARQAVFNAPKEMAVAPNGDIFVVDTENHAIRMIEASTWIVRTIAGNGTAGPGVDGGSAVQPCLARPHGAVVATDGTIYIGDSGNHRVRKLTRAA
jgi:DNA-binding beta-propeller fold protein YncE